MRACGQKFLFPGGLCAFRGGLSYLSGTKGFYLLKTQLSIVICVCFLLLNRISLGLAGEKRLLLMLANVKTASSERK